MALRNLAATVRTAAPRLLPLSAPRVLPPSGTRARPFCSSPSTGSGTQSKFARDWYLTQRERYDDLTREFANLCRVVTWTRRLDRLLRGSYILVAPVATSAVFSGWIDHHKNVE